MRSGDFTDDLAVLQNDCRISAAAAAWVGGEDVACGWMGEEGGVRSPSSSSTSLMVSSSNVGDVVTLMREILLDVSAELTATS